jgi:SAM-dependent methyltransferase
MTTQVDTPVEERIVGVLRELGIERAHFASRNLGDWRGLTVNFPDAIASLTLVCPLGFDSQALAPLGERLLVFNADRGGATATIDRNLAALASATKVTLSDYGYPNNYADIGIEQGEGMIASMLDFLAGADSGSSLSGVSSSIEEGEVDDIYFRVQGAGPPLVLLPLGAAPVQWDPIVAAFTGRYCVITLTGPALGMVGSLEGRGRTPGYLSAVGSLIDAAQIQPGEKVLEAGCGTGVLCRWVARRTDRQNPVAGVDVNTYFLREAADIARREGMEDVVSFHEGSAEALPFDDNSFDVVFSSTVIQRVNADLMLPELVRVVKPGGRIAVLGHAHDMNRWVNLPLRTDLKARIESPPWVDDPGHPQGCDDSSLYRRFAQLGLENTRMFPFISTFSEPDRLQFMQGGILPTLEAEEADEWRAAAAQAQSDGTFFISTPFHCAVGTKP